MIGSALIRNMTWGKMLWYLIFHGVHIILFAVGWYTQATNASLAPLNTLHFSVWISRGSALALTLDISLLLLPMCRHLMTFLRPKLRWLPLDETLYFHRQVAMSMAFWTMVHVGGHYVNFFNIEKNLLRQEAAVQILYTQAGGVTGHVMLVCMFIMFCTAHTRIRQQAYETFWWGHRLYAVFFLAMYTHATGCFVRDSTKAYSPFAGEMFWTHCKGYEGWRWELIVAAWFVAEKCWREWCIRRETKIVRVIKHPYDALEIQISKPSFSYKPGQWLFLNIPAVSKDQWHPFTITSCPFDPYISVHIRQVGDFTRSLASTLGVGKAQSDLYDELDPMGIYEVALAQGEEMPRIRIDGPYGAPAEDVLENEVAVLVGTGIGVTPWAAILKNIWHMRSMPNPPTRLRRVEFIWVCKDTTSFEWFQALLSSLEAQSAAEAIKRTQDGGSGIEFLKIHTYLTQRLNVDEAQNIILNSIGMDKDPLTQLTTNTNFGRPDFGKVLKDMKDGILNQAYGNGLGGGKRTDVGVYFCGPNAAARDIDRACKEATGDGVRFRFWKEHF